MITEIKTKNPNVQFEQQSVIGKQKKTGPENFRMLRTLCLVTFVSLGLGEFLITTYFTGYQDDCRSING